MKKVRFETPIKRPFNSMDESECHSPRPFIGRQISSTIPEVIVPKKLVYSNDPVHRFECSNSSPYPTAKKTVITSVGSVEANWLPSNDLNLSMLDCHEPRKFCKSGFTGVSESRTQGCDQPKILTSIENTEPPNVLQRDNSFFFRRDNVAKYLEVRPVERQLNGLNLGKENEVMNKNNTYNMQLPVSSPFVAGNKRFISQYDSKDLKPKKDDCLCHHCNNVPNSGQYLTSQPMRLENPCENLVLFTNNSCRGHCQANMPTCFHHDQVPNCHKTCSCLSSTPISPKNTVDKKTWAIQKIEQRKQSDSGMEVEKQINVSKEKREPTIGDLLRIIKLQNEQLQLLQEKVDKFILSSNNKTQLPSHNYVSEQIALQAMDSEHKISIGVMTSFEMVRTSTVINKEIVQQTTENAQVHCNRSQISIKEVVTKPVNMNFLDGLTPVPKEANPETLVKTTELSHSSESEAVIAQTHQNANEDKTLNELSLYNVHVDNATTPLMSPDQSLYLDVRDYSDSDSSSEHSNVGWTYYNKVMTHVNGMLHHSDMPSSASAMYRNTRQQCIQMQIDKTNVSVTKRVKFGDDPMGINQPQLHAASSDTSLKMNQLAAKYLKVAPAPRAPQLTVKSNPNPIDMSFATRNYMERHRLLLPGTSPSRTPPQCDIPRFLDITALKQQPKLL